MKVLLIEDERELALNIREYLKGDDILCEWASCAREAREKLAMYEYDCIILDLMLPDGDGIHLLKEIKNEGKNSGVLIISAKNTLDSKIEGLAEGADDYLTKPFHLAELRARVFAIWRRKFFDGKNKIVFNEIEIEPLSRTVRVYGKPMNLTRNEYALLLYLIENENRVLSRSSIAEHLSGDMADMLDNFDFVYAHIKNLKSKLKNAGAKNYIKTLYGLGYKWEKA